jgi:C4-dicarboxylate-binding protein DctP
MLTPRGNEEEATVTRTVDSNSAAADGFRPKPRDAEHTLRWVLAHEPPVVFEEAARVFESYIREKSNGDIDVEMFRIDDYATRRGQSALSREELVASVQRGDIEMAHCYVSAMGSFHERLWAIELPFLFRSYAHADAVWEGPVAGRLMEGLEDIGLRGVAFAYSGGFRIVPTRERQLRCIDDFRGLNLRTAGNPVPEALYQELGGSAVGAPLEDIAAMHRAGQIEGCEITFVRYQACGLEDIFPVINVTGHSLFTTMTVLNDSWFRNLPDRHQATIMEAGKAACRVERETAIKEESATRAELERRGFTVVEMEEAEHAALRAIGTKLQQRFAPRFGADIIEAIVEAGVQAPS